MSGNEREANVDTTPARPRPQFPSDDPIPEVQQQAACVQRVLESRTFARSPRLLSFLKYVCEQTLSQALDELSEQQVGIHVFGRPSSYNPGDDNIVRTTARQLRQRLALYYQEEGKYDEFQISIPRGGYAVTFLPAVAEQGTPAAEEPVPAPVEPEQEERAERAQARYSYRRTSLVFFLAGICFALAGLMTMRWIARSHAHSASPLWGQMFAADHRTILAPGDAGLNLYDNVAKTQVSLEDYISGRYIQQSAADLPKTISWAPFADRRYTSMVDLMFSDRLRQQHDFRSAQYEVRFARDLKMDDFRGPKNVILLGAPSYNPWVQLFENRLNFRMRYDGPSNTITVFNTRPTANEKAAYQWSASDPSHQGYATISLVPNLDGRGEVLLIQGTTIAGMDGATTFLFDNPDFTKAIGTDASGGVAPFEVLLETDMLASASPAAHLIAVRRY